MFHVSSLKKNITRKKRVVEKVTKLEFNANISEEYEVKAIWDNAIYARKLEGHLPKLYYLVT